MDTIPDFVTGQIYLITSTKTWKQYVGQTRTHYRKGDTYYATGFTSRWQAHIKEAQHQYKHESAKLNRAIRKYGSAAFDVELIHECPLKELDYHESYYIKELDTIKYGYNLTTGGKCGQPLEHIRANISNSLKKYNDDEKLGMFEGKEIVSVKLNRIDSCGLDIASLTFRLTTDDYVKVDFGGRLCPFDESLKRAIKFALVVTDESKIVVQERLIALVNLPKAAKDDRLEQNSKAQVKAMDSRYESLKSFDIENIGIEKRAYRDIQSIVLVVKIRGVKTIRQVSFGGRLLNQQECLDKAVELALKLVTRDKIVVKNGIKHDKL